MTDNELMNLIDKLIEVDLTPEKIYHVCGKRAMKYDKEIKDSIMSKREKETERYRDVKVIWNTKPTAEVIKSLKENTKSLEELFIIKASDLRKENVFYNYYGQEVVYITDIENMNIDFYILLYLLEPFKIPVCGGLYQNKQQVWKELHITSKLTPDEFFKMLVDKKQIKNIVDDYNRLFERITTMI